MAKYRGGNSWRDGTVVFFFRGGTGRLFFFPRRDGAVAFFSRSGTGRLFFFRGGTGRLYFFSEAGRGGCIFFRGGTGRDRNLSVVQPHGRCYI